ncbi:dihydrolipoamide acetyltransferase family protein [Pseudogemmobacter sonorensis]|uniref:dihydrolipoamide acetyltransferase family protein n=1 Tax=Pseudogemmobacter sonorensis TaxID=2989681 RepID=UPI00367C07D9
MVVEILMPAISPSMVSGKLVRWHVEPGAKIRKGDVLAELETDKAALDIEAPADGVLERILVAGGTPDVPVETVIGLIGDGKAAAAAAEVAPAPLVAVGAQDEPPRRISPLARRLAKELGVDPEGIRGSGPKGRVIAADIRDAAAAAQSEAAAVPPSPAAPPTATPPLPVEAIGAALQVEPHNAMRSTIARRLVEAKQTVPHFYLEIRCEVDALLDLRRRLNAALLASGAQTKLTVNDLVMKAYALAIARTPATMVTWSDEGLIRHSTVDIGLAVALENGLITPILRDAARLSAGALSDAARDAITRAREGRLAPTEYSGGLAGISNLGMYGISAFSAIINPPQSMNLAVGGPESALALRAGEVVEVHHMRLTLSVDHRAIDGAVAAELMARLKVLIETPMLLAT